MRDAEVESAETAEVLLRIASHPHILTEIKAMATPSGSRAEYIQTVPRCPNDCQPA